MKASYTFGLSGYRAPLLALGLTALSLLPTTLATAQADDNAAARPNAMRRLTVTGQGEIKVKPDTAVLTIGVVTEDKSSQNAVRANAEASQKVQAAIKGTGIAEKDIQTSNYSVQPVYEADHPGRRATIVGFRVYNQVRVTIREIAKLSSVIDAATEAGSNTIEGINFTKENQTEVENEALAKAVADARRKADQLAKAADIEIRGVWEINESGINRPPWPMYAMAKDAGFGGASTPIQPGEVSVTANVTVVYQLGPMKAAQVEKNLRKVVRVKTFRR